RRRRPPAHHRRRGLGAGRRVHVGAAQARRQPRGRRRAPQPAPPRRPHQRRARPRPLGALHPPPGPGGGGARREQDLRERGVECGGGLGPFGGPAYGWAMEDETGFCKVLVAPADGAIMGAHIMGPQAATLVQPLVLAATLGITARTLAERPYWIHPALTEVVQQALIDAL